MISGFEGKDINQIIETIKNIWKKQGTKKQGAEVRYKLVIGRVNQRGVFTPTVSTKAGTETILLWNLTQENARKLEELSRKEGIPVSYRSYLWFNGIPAVLPNESEKELISEEKEK